MRNLHRAIVTAFSINKDKFDKKAFGTFRKRLHEIRKLVGKLRNINYYLETAFFENAKSFKVKIPRKKSGQKSINVIAKDELDMLEYLTYRLIEKAVVLDKKLLEEYSHKEMSLLKKEKIEYRDMRTILGKESLLLEHLEAKLPPPSLISINLLKEPRFSHWTARLFALLYYLEHIYKKEKVLLNMLKRNKRANTVITKKISMLIEERYKLIKIMEEKAISIGRFKIDKDFKRQLHNLTTILTI